MKTFTKTKIHHIIKYLPVKHYLSNGHKKIPLRIPVQEDPIAKNPDCEDGKEEFDIEVICLLDNTRYMLTVKNGQVGFVDIYDCIQKVWGDETKTIELQISVRGQIEKGRYSYTAKILNTQKPTTIEDPEPEPTTINEDDRTNCILLSRKLDGIKKLINKESTDYYQENKTGTFSLDVASSTLNKEFQKIFDLRNKIGTMTDDCKERFCKFEKLYNKIQGAANVI